MQTSLPSRVQRSNRLLLHGIFFVAVFVASSWAAAAAPLDELQHAIESNQAIAPSAVRPKWIAFSISRRCLRDTCGDGHWGVGIGETEQKAMVTAAVNCAQNSLRPGSCGNNGVYPACRPDGQPSWSAFAIYDDGREITEDGEVVASPSQAIAQQDALKNCHIGLHQCSIAWIDQVACPDTR